MANNLNSTYDRDLLASAPAATRAERQEGYNVDLLEKGETPAPIRTPSARVSPAPVSVKERAMPTPQRRDAEETPSPSLKKRSALPFWRTGKGIAVIAVVVIVVLGAVIGGAVGGTVGKKSHTSGGSSASSTTGGGAGQGADTSTVATAPNGVGDPTASGPGPTSTQTAPVGR